MDTDSLYFALSASKLKEVVKPALQVELENCTKIGSHETPLATELLASSNSSLKGTGQQLFAVSATSLMVGRKVNAQARECRLGSTV